MIIIDYIGFPSLSRLYIVGKGSELESTCSVSAPSPPCTSTCMPTKGWSWSQEDVLGPNRVI